ncbi:MAG: histidine kinase [Clostridia bacterium]|nr:histidine kinase [Clostridia bacterium]
MKSTKELILFFISCVVNVATCITYAVFKYNSVLFVAIAVVALFGVCFSLVKIYLKQRRLVIRAEKELSEQKTQVMLSQIQPHFLYNALSAIAAIPDTPSETRVALAKFGKYLRGNLNSISANKPISFEQELMHVETYLELEKMRFGDKLNVQYVIREKEFNIPSLSLQMFVENAVKHGITQKENGGTLIISTESDGKNAIITVKDDGVGFNVNVAQTKDGRAHVGISNAKARLKSMVNGVVDVKSEIGEGTTVTIKIPKGGNVR